MSKSVLVVDDEPIIHTAISRIFIDSQLHIEHAFSIEEALDSIDPSFGVLLTDVQLAGDNGFDLIEKMNEMYPSVKIIIMTGFATLEMAKHSIELGATAFFTKPFKDPEKLVQMVTRAAI